MLLSVFTRYLAPGIKCTSHARLTSWLYLLYLLPNTTPTDVAAHFNNVDRSLGLSFTRFANGDLFLTFPISLWLLSRRQILESWNFYQNGLSRLSKPPGQCIRIIQSNAHWKVVTPCRNKNIFFTWAICLAQISEWACLFQQINIPSNIESPLKRNEEPSYNRIRRIRERKKNGKNISFFFFFFSLFLLVVCLPAAFAHARLKDHATRNEEDVK